jgi:type II secretory pathway component GspD/PulD (secretin)
MLLVPLAAGACASAGLAQAARPPATPPGAAQPTRTFADPKDQVKQARKALDEGKLDRAQDLANQAAAARDYSWGLFDDTPDSVLKDVASARAKADRGKADQMVKDGRTLLNKPTRTSEERLANVEQATKLAYNAQRLHGPYGMFDFGDTADSLVTDCTAARTKLMKANPNLLANAGAAKPAVKPAVGAARPGSPSGLVQTGYKNTPSFAAMTPEKRQALALVAEARKLMAANQLSAARAKVMEARKVADAGRCSFSVTEDSPDLCYKHIQAEGIKQINALTKDADAHLAKRDYAKVDASLKMAGKISVELGFSTKMVDDRKAMLVKASGGTYGLPATMAMAPTANTHLPPPSFPIVPVSGVAPPTGEILVPALPTPPAAAHTTPPAFTPTVVAHTTPPVVAPTIAAQTTPPIVAPTVAANTPTPVAPTLGTPPAVGQAMTGKALLDQATKELMANDLKMAKELAIRAQTVDPTCQAEAVKLLGTIEAEETTQRLRNAKTSFTSAVQAYYAKQYEQALTLFKLIDPTQLTPNDKATYATLTSACAAEVGKVKGVAQTAGQDPSLGAKAPADTVAVQQNAMTDLEFQKLRSEGNKLLSDAQAAYGKGDTDLAMSMLQDFQTRVRSSSLSASKQALLLRPIDGRLETFAIMKRTMDRVTQETKDRKDFRDQTVGKSLAEAQRNEEIAKKVREINELQKQGKLAEAEQLAAQTRQLDPDSPVLETIHNLAKMKHRRQIAKDDKDERELFVYEGLNAAERPGHMVDVNNPLYIDPVRRMIASQRGINDGGLIRTRTAAEFEIERKLDKPVTIELVNAPLKEAIAKLQRMSDLNIVFDDPAIKDAQVPLDEATVSISIAQPLSLRNALSLILSKCRLSYTIDKDVVQITTPRLAQGRLYTKVFQVMELVTPVPDFALAQHQSLTQAINASRPVMPWMANQQGNSGTGNPGLRNPNGGLGGGNLVSQGNTPFLNSSNQLEANLTGNAPSSMSSSATMAPTPNREFVAGKLKQMITKMVNASSWEDQGGPGRIEYFDAGAALVVNQTADVIKEVADLLEALRRLQDLSVSVEIRIVSLSESFFERIGVDFDLNVTNHNTALNRELATGQFAPSPFINALPSNGGTVGYSPATGFTPDLGVPIRGSSYNLTQPPFGGYQNFLSPTLNGGLSVGLAFLNDIQVYMFLEAASGDRRVNFMQAPKITLFNGQTSTVTVGDYAYFATNLTVFNFAGQTVYQPTNIAYPVGSAVNPTSGSTGVSVAVQAVISADRRFVRMNLAPSLNSLASANVPLLPVTVFITPVFEGGSQGQPIPFTQFLQQPAFTSIDVQTTVSVPDGGTVLLGGLKAMSEGRDEFGPPVLSQIPYLNRLFKNVGIGRDTRHIMIMVTPRIIISSEEEMAQAPTQQ